MFRPLQQLRYRLHAHVVTWFGQSGHVDAGYDSNDPNVIYRQIDEMASQGIRAVNLLFSGKDSPNTPALFTWSSIAQSQGVTISLCWDKQAKTTAEDVRWMQKFLIKPAQNYWKLPDGRSVLLVFDDPSADQLAALDPSIAVLYRNTNGFSKPKSAGCFGWPSPGNEQGYVDYFAKQLAPLQTQQQNKIVMPHISPGFVGASWNKADPNFKPTPWDNGREWQRSIQRVLDMSKTLKFSDVLIGTFNDHEEGTGIESVPIL